MRLWWAQSQGTRPKEAAAAGPIQASLLVPCPCLVFSSWSQQVRARHNLLCSDWESSQGGHRRNQSMGLASRLAVQGQEHLQRLTRSETTKWRPAAATSWKAPSSSLKANTSLININIEDRFSVQSKGWVNIKANLRSVPIVLSFVSVRFIF